MFTRREFFKMVAGAIAAAASLLYGASARARELSVKLEKLPALKKVGGSGVVKLGGKDIMLIRETEKKVRALSPVCTHRKCSVKYESDGKRLVCGCHNSQFDLNGKVLRGPASDPLPAFKAKLQGDGIVVTVK